MSQVFPVTGVTISALQSDEHRLSLHNLSREAGGRYRCEVSTEAPHFLTAVRTVEVSVIALPRGPDIAGTRASYSLQENISANCSTSRSLPEPEISWYINGDNVDHSSVTVFSHHHDNTTHGLIDSVTTLNVGNLRRYCKVLSALSC